MFCGKCGQLLEDGSKFCKHCGATVPTAEQWGTSQWGTPPAVPPARTPGVPPPPPPPYGNAVNTGAAGIPVRSSGNKTLTGCLIGAGIAAVMAVTVFIAIIVGTDVSDDTAGTNVSGGEIAFSSLSEQKRETLTKDLFEYLDRYFVSIVEDNDKLMQFIILGALGNESEIEDMIGEDMMKIVEKWAADNRIDLEDWADCVDIDKFTVDYVLHLMQRISEEM